mgnify:CR=1 FL=1
MKFVDLAELAGRNLREAMLRNVLTTLGIAVGVASLVAMLSLGVGLQELLSGRLERTGLFDTIFVTSRRGIGEMGRPRKAEVAPEQIRPLDEAARNEIAGLPHVQEVYPEIRFPAELRYQETPRMTTVAGLPDSARQREAFDGIKGAFFTSPDADETILQIEFARDLEKEPTSLLGKDLVLRYAERQQLAPSPGTAASSPTGDGGVNWGFSVIPREKKLRIVGIIETEPGSGFGGMGRSRVFIPLLLAQKLSSVQFADLRQAMRSSGRPEYLSLSVRVDGAARVPAVQESIKKLGFQTFSLHDMAKGLRLAFAVLDSFLGAFGSLALAVASLGIINTLVMAILERRREIGILKALGAADRDVKQLFFAEAGAMGLIGGALGVGLGWAIGRIINFGINIYLKQQELPPQTIWSVPWWLVLGAMAFALLVSLAAGLYPASRAAKLDPVQALRYE